MYKQRQLLNNKPLVEAILELRWNLEPSPANPILLIDPNHRMFLARLYDRLIEKYPFEEELPSASAPLEISAYMIQHRFRATEAGWPLVQVGPGILTLNATSSYVWEDFEERAHLLLGALFSAHPAADKLNIKSITLRYIDATPFDYDKESITSFLRENLKTEIALSEDLFDGTGVHSLPTGVDARIGYLCEEPKGSIHIKYHRGRINDVDSIIWETLVQSISEDAPNEPDAIMVWLDKAHSLAGDWFFKLIDGELLERFK